MIAAAVLLSVWSCRKEDPDTQPDPVPGEIGLSEECLSFAAEGGELSLTVTAPERPVISGLPAWLSLKDGVYDRYTLTYTLQADFNREAGPREAVLTVTAGTLARQLTVEQAAFEVQDVDASLTNPKAGSAAKKVYGFLLSQYGKTLLSGVQAGGTANNNDRVNELAALSGKHPAVAGYDYIFLQYSPTPAGWSWVVNYDDISAAKEQWENNGLVSFMWHWNVPTSKEAWDKGLQGDFTGYNFYCDQTNFDIRRALVPGNWENDFLMKDIEKVAGCLKLLQAAGIPVLWRPLHEAAGNYTLYGPNGAWFWWGRGGADACKQLWKLLREQLEGKYGLDNLIWVWTLDATPGAESQYADWYPGNDCVDIVGVDIYANDTAAKSRQYKAAQALSGGRKMTTISECGNIPDPDLCLADGEAWSWFLTWSLEDYPLNTASYWKKLMNGTSVLTRETMPNLK